MRLSYSIVAFIDVLGFSSMVASDAQSGDGKYLAVFVDVIERANEIPGGSMLDIRMFSDSIVLAAPLTAVGFLGVLNAVGWLQRTFLANGILVRGGVAYGRHFGDRAVIFSEALVTAYRLESTQARYPRVLVEGNTWNWFAHEADAESADDAAARSLLKVDRDGAIFVNFGAGVALSSFRDSVANCVTDAMKAPAENVLEKIRWLVDYVNHICEVTGEVSLKIFDPRLEMRQLL